MKAQPYLFALLAGAALAMPAETQAQSTYRPEPGGKEIYIPKEFAGMNMESDTSQFCYGRMRTTPDLVIFWERPFGADPMEAPDYKGRTMKVDVDQVLKRTQHFYDYYVAASSGSSRVRKPSACA